MLGLKTKFRPSRFISASNWLDVSRVIPIPWKPFKTSSASNIIECKKPSAERKLVANVGSFKSGAPFSWKGAATTLENDGSGNWGTT